MNIVKENIDDLNAVLKVKIVPDDYNERYNKALRRYQKKIDMPGFRPGKVPVDMVKKRFGKHILVEEINDILSESLHKYISENKIDILGNPLPKDNVQTDFEQQTEFEFQYEVGLAPKINIQLSEKATYPYYVVKIDDALIDQHIEYLRRNFGQVIHPEVSEEKDILIGDFNEVDKQGMIVPGGFFKTTLIGIEKITSEENKKKLIGLKKDDKVILTNLSADAGYMHEILELSAERVSDLSLQFSLKNLSRISLAELNQDLFDKVYGTGKVNNLEEFKNKIVEEISARHSADSDRRLMNDIVDSLLKKENLILPETFLKKFFFLTNKEKTTMEQVEKEYHTYSDSLKWQLIENHLLKIYNIVVTQEEIEQYFSDLVKMYYARNGMQATEEQIKDQVKKAFSEEKQIRNAYDKMYEKKLIDLFKKTFTLEKKELPIEEFYKK